MWLSGQHCSADGMRATCCTPCLGIRSEMELSHIMTGDLCIATSMRNVGVDCDGATTPPAPIGDSALPAGWSTAIPWAVDDADRVLTDIQVSYQPTNTPSACAAQCAA